MSNPSEKLSPSQSSDSVARCRLSQLCLRMVGGKRWMEHPELVVGKVFLMETRMGRPERWRVVEAGKDPLLEQVKP